MGHCSDGAGHRRHIHESIGAWTGTSSVSTPDDALDRYVNYWRRVFKPLYRDYVDLIHAGGRFAFFHSDGCISPIIDDLIEVGIDALNCQLFCMDIEDLGSRFAGKITFWGEIDRQYVLPFGSTDDVRAAVNRVRRPLDRGHGGVIAQCEWGSKIAAQNIMAVFEEWEKPLATMTD